jgi:AcrR family transcriptional regulator
VTDSTLTRERILEAAEEVLRRFGPAKATVVDVARALGVSHGSVYRHFPSKAALRDAVAERWLARVSTPLAKVAAGSGPAPGRLARWFDALIAFKRRKVLEDPELFATYSKLVSESRQVVRAHVEALVSQLAAILADGAARKELETADPARTARALFTATARFHNPAHAAEWSDPGIDSDFRELFALLLRGLGAGRAQAVRGARPARTTPK